MKRAFAIVARLFFAFAWLLVACGAVLIAIEESGVLTRVVERRLARELGPLGPFVEVERARLLWFEPGLMLEGVTFRGELGSDDRWRRGPERMRLSAIHVRLDPTLDPQHPVRDVEVRGGRLALSQAVLDAANALAQTRADVESTGTPPNISVRGIALEVDPEAGETVPLGSADLRIAAAAPAAGGGAAPLTLSGRIYPSLGGAVQAPAPIMIEGGSAADGSFHVRATARSLEVDSAGLPPQEAARVFGLERFHGELDVELRAWSRADAGPPEASLSVRLEQGLLQRLGEPPASEVHAGLDLRFAPERGMPLSSPDAWAGRAQAEATYDRARLSATALIGADAAPGSWLEAWGQVLDLHLDEQARRAFHVAEQFDVVETFAALEPSGQINAEFGLRVPRASLQPDAPRDFELVALAVHDGRTAMAFRGWKDELGVRRGVPLPVDDLRGRIAFALAPALAQPIRVALVEMSGDHGAGRAFGEGLITAAGADQHSDLDFEFSVPTVPIEPRLGEALRSLEGIHRTWEALAPSGGSVATHWRLRRRDELRGVTAQGHVSLAGVGLMWREVPIPLDDLVGSLELRWAETASLVADEAPTIYGDRPTHRPIGVLWEVAHDPGAPRPAGLAASARGMIREAPTPDEVQRADIPVLASETFEVELADLLLRGRDWDVLAARFPEIGAQVAELRGQGRIDARFVGRRPTAASAYRYDVEVTAQEGEVVLTPSVFKRQTQNVAGRVLLAGRELALPTPEVPDPPVESLGRFHLFGAWGDETTLASTGTIPSGGGGDVTVHGAGVDPASPTFKGALASSMAAQGDGREVDLVDLRVEGRLDFEARVLLPAEPQPSGTTLDSSYRIFLRDNRFTASTLELSSLTGVLLQEGETLSSPLVRGSLAGTPVELTDVLLFPLSVAADHPRADPRLASSGFVGDGDGFAFQADWRASGLALDREHLRPLVDAPTLDVLLQRGLSGTIDVEKARMLAVSPRVGGGRVALRGTVTPRDVRLTAGIPIALQGGSIEIEDVVLEAGRVRGWWRLADLDAEIAERSLTDAAMTMTYVDGRLTIDNLRGMFAGGELTSLGAGEQADRAIAVDLTAPYAYAVGLRLKRVAVQEVLGVILSGGVEDLGELTSTLRVRGRGADVLALAGSGAIRLDNARLWSIPVVRELFRSLGTDATAVFDRMELAWTLESGTIHLNDIRVRSPLLHLVGEGAVELTGEVSSDLQVRYSLVDKLGPLNRIVYWLNNSLWRVAVLGDMQRPVVRVRSSLFELVLGFDDEVPRSLPLPGWGSVGRRF